MSKNIRALANDSHSELKYQKITDKQWSVYYYLLSISHWNEARKETHRYVDKNKINISAASKLLGMSRPTFYKAIEQLELYSLIFTFDNQSHYYYLPIPEVYAEANIKTIQFLLSFRKFIGIDLLRTYLILRKYYTLFKKEGEIKYFVKKDLVDLLGHNVKDSSIYGIVEIYLNLLENWGLLSLKANKITTPTGSYIRYSLIEAIDYSSKIETISFEKSELQAIGITENDFKVFKGILKK